jgi:hypothetical protein
MRSKLAIVSIAGASVVFAAALQAGGWVVVSVRELPEYAIAGEPLPLTFIVRAHGLTPRNGLAPMVAARLRTEAGTLTVTTSAVPTGRPGEYTAYPVVSYPGRWTIQIVVNELNDSTLHELPVIAAGSPAPPPLSPPAVGERLFVAKGCIACHVNRELQSGDLGNVFKTSGFGSEAPELTGKRFADAYLKSLLADPTATRGSDVLMPDLGLTSSEIAALTAFINRERPGHPAAPR